MSWDLLIIGAGPAGTSTALHLHAQNPELAQRTLVLEKDHFPREKYCAGGTGGRALRRLAKIGVVPDVPMVPIRRMELFSTHYKLTLEDPGFGVVVRRVEFDHFLAKEVQKRGISLREGARVREIRPGGAGVEVVLEDGEVLTARAVVGADGVTGTTRREMGLSGGEYRAQVLELDTEMVDGDPARDTLRFDASDLNFQGYAWDFPTQVNGEEKVCRGMYLIRTLGEGNLRERLTKYLADRGLDIRNYRLKAFGERGFSYQETLSKSRMLLVGEAAGIDIATGEGIAQAVAYGAVAGGYLAKAFAAGNLEFSDWTRKVHLSGVGKNLFGRGMMLRFFYGSTPNRLFTEQLLHHNPAILDLYARGFAGKPAEPGLLWKLARDFPWAVVKGLGAGTPRGF